MRFELVKKVPIVEIGGKRCFLDTGFPHASMPVAHGVQEFFGIPGLHVAGVKALKRYTKFDYRNSEITTSDEPIPLEGGTTVPFEVRPNGWLVKMTVGGVEGMRYIDTGAAFSYVHIRADAGNDREFLFYKRLNEHLFQNDALRPDCTGNYYPRRNLERAVGWKVTIHPPRDTGVLVNFQTSHVLSGRTHNPLLYSAVWNIVFTPKIIDPFTGDEAHGPAALLFREAFINRIRARFAGCIEDYNNFLNVHNIEDRINEFQHEDFADEEELARLKESACRQWAPV